MLDLYRMCIEVYRIIETKKWGFVGHQTDTGGVGGGFGRGLEHYHCGRDTAAARRQSEAWGGDGDGDSNQLCRWKIPGWMLVSACNDHRDASGPRGGFFWRCIFPWRCTTLQDRRPRWKAWRRCCLRMPLASIWRGDSRPIRSKWSDSLHFLRRIF